MRFAVYGSTKSGHLRRIYSAIALVVIALDVIALGVIALGVVA